MEGQDRLDSWKQIAAYLGKSERTVRRWQEVEGLPVHRHPHQQRGSVWAYRSEIDAWLANRVINPDENVKPQFAVEPAVPRIRAVPLVAFLSLATVLAIGLALTVRDRQPPLLDPVQITALPGAVFGPAISPDGKTVAFHWSPSSGDDAGIYVRPIASDDLRPLVTNRADGDFIYNPAWSPDGQSIAYLRRITPGKGFAMYAVGSETWLCLIPVTGGPERRLVRIAKGAIFYANSAHLHWSRDGKWIVAPMNEGNTRGIYRISVATGEGRRLAGGVAQEFSPAISPNGRELVFMRQEGPPHASVERVFRQTLNTDWKPAGELVELFRGRSMSSGLAWLPSGEELLFCTANSALYGPFNSRMYRMSAEKGQDLKPLPLTGCSSFAVSPPDVSGEVSLIYAATETARSTLFQSALSDWKTTEPFALSSRFDAMPSYSPDGVTVAFVSNRSGQPEIWLARKDGGSPVRLTQGGNVASIPRWSPDGKQLVYGAATPHSSGATAEYSLYILPISGGNPVRIPRVHEMASDPAWSDEGDIYYWADTQLWRTSPDGAASELVTTLPAHFVHSTVIASGYVYYARPSAPFAICRVKLGSGDEQVLADGLLSPFFAATPRFIYYIRQAEQALYRQSLSDGVTKQIGELPSWKAMRRYILGLSVSPGEDTVVWALAGEQQLDLHLVSGFR